MIDRKAINEKGKPLKVAREIRFRSNRGHEKPENKRVKQNRPAIKKTTLE
jgi:hypothetical protein